MTLCDGTSFKVELSGRDRVVTVGPFASPIASITAKSATSVVTVANPAGCGTPPPEECKDEKGDPIECPVKP